MAVANGNLKMVKILVEKGADKNVVDEKNLTPLDYAKDENDILIVKYLEDLGR